MERDEPKTIRIDDTLLLGRHKHKDQIVLLQYSVSPSPPPKNAMALRVQINHDVDGIFMARSVPNPPLLLKTKPKNSSVIILFCANPGRCFQKNRNLIQKVTKTDASTSRIQYRRHKHTRYVAARTCRVSLASIGSSITLPST